MTRFMELPVIVDAEQWFPGKEVPGVNPPIPAELPDPYVRTVGQRIVFLEPGDWVVDNHKGRGYLVFKPELFSQLYTPLAENEEFQP